MSKGKPLSGPPIVWHCPICQFEALSKYSAKQHRIFASCYDELASTKAQLKGGGIVSG